MLKHLLCLVEQTELFAIASLERHGLVIEGGI